MPPDPLHANSTHSHQQTKWEHSHILFERGTFAVIYTQTSMYTCALCLPMQLYVLLSVSQFIFVFAFFKLFTQSEAPTKLVIHRHCTCFLSVVSP